MCNPTTGSPTITLCQLRPNYHVVSNLPNDQILEKLRPNVQNPISPNYKDRTRWIVNLVILTFRKKF